MDNAIVHAKKVRYKKENPPQGLNKDFASSKEDCLSERLVMKVKPGDLFPSSNNKSQIGDFCTQKMFLQHISGLKKRIPKQIMSLEEKYLRHCVELIHTSALRANSCTIPSKINLLPDRLGSREVSGRSGYGALFLVSSGTENVAVSSSVDPIVGSITGSTSMMNILNSPLLRQLGDSLNDDISYGKTSALEVREPISYAVTSSPGELCVGSSLKLQKGRVVPEDHFFGSEPLHKRLVSSSSATSIFSDPSSFSSSSSSSSSLSSSSYCQGMLHCSWNSGFPRYVFSVEDQKEVYTTNLSKVESLNDTGLDYIYTFHSRAGKGGNEIHDDESDLVGKMVVSPSSTLCPRGAEIMETQFVLCATADYTEGGINTSNQTLRKNKCLSKKVVDMFRGSHSYRRRTSSKFDGSFAIQENFLEPGQEENVVSQSVLPPNLELAAIVVKDHIHGSRKEAKIGGWGLKFLKEGGHRQTNESPMAESVHCEYCRQNTGHHSTIMDVLVPAGFHGGPRTKNGGPSSLVERWRSGGSCDCGGWDIGCPLTVLNARPNNTDVLHHTGVFGKSNSFDLHTQGSKQSLPVIKLVNIHDGLYYIHYQSTLSTLQSLSIAVAIIHSHSPTLRPKVYRN